MSSRLRATEQTQCIRSVESSWFDELCGVCGCVFADAFLFDTNMKSVWASKQCWSTDPRSEAVSVRLAGWHLVEVPDLEGFL
jgi:hypothetical protein